jgi:Transglycosylase SLT domain
VPQGVVDVPAFAGRGTARCPGLFRRGAAPHHPDAFRDLAQAFDPAANADYGARFLSQLHDRTGSWPEAVAQYHSATRELGQDYQRKVYAALPEEQRLAFAIAPATALRPWGGLYASYTPPTGPRPQTARVIPLPSAAGGFAAPGRTLNMYRAMPVRTAARRP